MNEDGHRDEIVRLEEQIDELAARIESCRKFILAGRRGRFRIFDLDPMRYPAGTTATTGRHNFPKLHQISVIAAN